MYKRTESTSDTTAEYYLKNLGIVDLTTGNWTWYVNGVDRVAKITPRSYQQPDSISVNMGADSNHVDDSFYLYDHLGNTRVVYTPSVRACLYVDIELEYAADYYPYGKLLREFSNGQIEKYLTTQHERDQETGLDYRGARFYDSDVCRFLSLDPLAADYPSLSDYSYVAGNPVIFIDGSGKDFVYFDNNGQEVKRIKSDAEYRTFIQVKKNASIENLKDGWQEVPMPKVIQTRTASGEDVSDPKYQEYDYLIAARVGKFNWMKNNGKLNVYTDGGDLIPADVLQQIPDLDPTLIKSIAMQETHIGQEGDTDLMESNNTGDWGDYKTNYGLNKGSQPVASHGLYAGIRILVAKGFRGGITYNKDTGEKTYTFQGWDNATLNYNGSSNKEQYQKDVQQMINEAQVAKPQNY